MNGQCEKFHPDRVAEYTGKNRNGMAIFKMPNDVLKVPSSVVPSDLIAGQLACIYQFGKVVQVIPYKDAIKLSGSHLAVVKNGKCGLHYAIVEGKTLLVENAINGRRSGKKEDFCGGISLNYNPNRSQHVLVTGY